MVYAHCYYYISDTDSDMMRFKNSADRQQGGKRFLVWGKTLFIKMYDQNSCTLQLHPLLRPLLIAVHHPDMLSTRLLIIVV
jgi:hypothetical protein